MSEETEAVLMTICLMAILLAWAPCLSLLVRHWRRYGSASIRALGQSRESPGTVEQRVEVQTQTFG
jgi:hypothetical protein